MSDLIDHLTSPAFSRQATWATIYALVPFSLITAIFMLKLGPRLLLDWGYTWVMVALGLWVTRIIYVVKIDPQPLGNSLWSVFFALNVLAAMVFTMAVLIRTGYYVFHEGKRHNA